MKRIFHRRISLVLCISMILSTSGIIGAPGIAAPLGEVRGENFIRWDFSDGQKLFSPSSVTSGGGALTPASTEIAQMGQNESHGTNSTAYFGEYALKWNVGPFVDGNTGFGKYDGEIPKLNGKNPTKIGFWMRLEGITFGTLTRMFVGVMVDAREDKSSPFTHADASYRGFVTNTSQFPWSGFNGNKWTWVEFDISGTTYWNAGQTANQTGEAIKDSDALYFPNGSGTNVNANNSFFCFRHTGSSASGTGAIYIDGLTFLYEGASGSASNTDILPPSVDVRYNGAVLDGLNVTDDVSNITVAVSDTQSGLDNAKLNLKLDELDITSASYVNVVSGANNTSVSIGVSQIPQGQHTLRVEAWDNFGFRTIKTSTFTVDIPDESYYRLYDFEDGAGIRASEFNTSGTSTVTFPTLENGKSNASNDSNVYCGERSLNWRVNGSADGSFAIRAAANTPVKQVDGKNPTGIGFWMRTDKVGAGGIADLFGFRVGLYSGAGTAGANNNDYVYWTLTPQQLALGNNEWKWIEITLTTAGGGLAGGGAFLGSGTYSASRPFVIPGNTVNSNGNSFLWFRKNNTLAVDFNVQIDNITFLYDGATGPDASDTSIPSVSVKRDGVDLNGAMFSDRTIPINIEIVDNESGLNNEKLSIRLDGSDIANTSQTTLTQGYYKTTADLSISALEGGTHTLMVTAFDKYGWTRRETAVFSIDAPVDLADPGTLAALQILVGEAKELFDNTYVSGTVTQGRYPTAARTAFNSAIITAEGQLANNWLTQTAAQNAIASLGAAMDAYKAARTSATWDQFQEDIDAGAETALKEHLRCVWISTVVNIDFPSTNARGITPARVDAQKAELEKIVNDAADLGMNAIIFQVRPTSDAMFKSSLAPWSYWLTGQVGYTGDLIDSQGQEFDPLAYIVALAHAKNIELHTWFNPYRIAMADSNYSGSTTAIQAQNAVLDKMDPALSALLGSHISTWGSRQVLDPAVPEGRKWIQDCVMEVVNNYDIDAVHFDDYFYPNSNNNDADTWATMNTAEHNLITKAPIASKDDWRRENTEMMIVELGARIKAAKPWVKFGISPSGNWRAGSGSTAGNTGLDGGGINAGTGTASPATQGGLHYSGAWADTRKWVVENYIDYIIPQIYWEFSHSTAPYGHIAEWWSRLIRDYGDPNYTGPDAKRNSKGEKTNCQLYIGMGLYRMDPSEGTVVAYFNNSNQGEGTREFTRQLNYNIGKDHISGSVWFTLSSSRVTANDVQALMTDIRTKTWNYPAIVPAMPGLGGVAPTNPTFSAASNGGVMKVSWTDTEVSTSEMNKSRYFIVYRSDSAPVNITDPRNIIAKIPAEAGKTDYEYIDATGVPTDKYVVTALNRLHDESDPSTVPQLEEPGVSIAPFNAQRNTNEAFILNFTADCPERFASAHFTMTAGAGVTFQEAVFHNAADGSYVDYNKSNRQLTVHLVGKGTNDKLIASLIFKPDDATDVMTYTIQSAGLSIVFDPSADDVTLPTTAQTVTTATPALALGLPAAPEGDGAVTVTVSENGAPVDGAAVYLLDELNNIVTARESGLDGAAVFASVPAGYYTIIAFAGGKNSVLAPLTVKNAGQEPETIKVPNVTIPKQVAGFEVGRSKRGYPDRNFRTNNGFALDFDNDGMNDSYPTRKYEIYRFEGVTAGALTTPVTTIAAGAARTFANYNHLYHDTPGSFNLNGWFKIHEAYTYVVVPIDNRGVAGPAATLTLSEKHSDVWKDEGLFDIPIHPLKHESRGVWLTTISGWPSSSGTSETIINNNKISLINFLDRCVDLNINLVYFQVKGMSDAFWESSYLPWSARLSGTQGLYPGWDPLAYMIEEAHKRNIEVHAWCNPYRANSAAPSLVGGMAVAPNNFVGGPTNAYTNDPNVPNHVGWAHPEWLAWDNTLILDPGIPEAREWVVDGLVEMVARYDLDGMHFDDYFYYEQNNSNHGLYEFNSNWRLDPNYGNGKTTFETFNTMEHINGGVSSAPGGRKNAVPGFDGMGLTQPFPNTPQGWADWRRNNISLLIAELHYAIKDIKPWVQISISPGGIYENSGDSYANAGQDNGTNVPNIAGRPTNNFEGLTNWPEITYPANPGGVPGGSAVPFGGSDTRGGMPLFYLHAADVVRWAHEGWIDVLTPQVYWSSGRYPVASHMVLTEWWRDALKGSNCLLTIGLPTYKVASSGDNDYFFYDNVDFDNPDGPALPNGGAETLRELRMAANMEGVSGTVAYSSTSVFSMSYTAGNKGNLTAYGGQMYQREYAQYAIAPPITWKGYTAPTAPKVALSGDALTITPQGDKEERVYFYALYAFDQDETIDISDVTKLVTLVQAKTSSGNDPRDPDPEAIEMEYVIEGFDADKVYVLTAFDRLRNESEPVILSDKTALAAAIAAFDALVETGFTSASWADAKAAYEAAVIVYDNANAMQKDVDAATDTLTGAMDLLDPIILNLAPGQAPSFVIRKNMIMQIKLVTNAESLTFTSSNSAIATVTQAGVVTGKSIGVVVIQIKDKNTGYVINVVINCTN